MKLEEPLKIKTVFNIEGGSSGLTEEVIYENQPTSEAESIEILSSATVESKMMGFINKNTKIGGVPLTIFSGPSILVARNGTFVGKMTYIEKGQFTSTDHAYVMTLKQAWKGKVNLRWFVFQYQELFNNLVTTRTGNGTFSKDYAEKQEIEIPDIKVQNKIAEKLLFVDAIERELDTIQNELDLLSQGKHAKLDMIYREKMKIIFNIEGGNSGLTEEVIYENQPASEDESLPILSSATTESNHMGSIDKDARLSDGEKLKVFQAPAIIVARNGFAGVKLYRGRLSTPIDTSSVREPGIWAADLVAGAVYHKYANNEWAYANILNSRRIGSGERIFWK